MDPDDLPEPTGPQGPDVKNDEVPALEDPAAEVAAGTEP
jgi:hypothetical protein